MSQSAKSQQPSGSTTRSTPASTPSKGARPIYASPTSTSRSKSNLPLPKVLPFPDIPVRPISREGSPLPSPGMQRLNSDQGRADSSIPMVVTGSSDSAEGSSSRTPTSPPVSSPLSHVQPSRLPIASPSRTRAQTSPATRPISIPPPFNSTSSTDLGRGTPDPPRLGGILAVSPTRPNDVPSPPLIRSALPPEQPASTPAKKLSRNPVPLPHSIRLSPPTSSQSFSNHMYQSLLRGHCADIRLVVRKWNVAWHVHKVVLIQAGTPISLWGSRCASDTSQPSSVLFSWEASQRLVWCQSSLTEREREKRQAITIGKARILNSLLTIRTSPGPLSSERAPFAGIPPC